jgi:hypothetical protein
MHSSGAIDLHLTTDCCSPDRLSPKMCRRSVLDRDVGEGRISESDVSDRMMIGWVTIGRCMM